MNEIIVVKLPAVQELSSVQIQNSIKRHFCFECQKILTLIITSSDTI